MRARRRYTRPRQVEPASWALPATTRVQVRADVVTEVELRHQLAGRVRLLLRPPAGAPAPPGPDDESWNGPAVRVVNTETQQSTRLDLVYCEDEPGHASSGGSVAPVGTPSRSATLLIPGHYRIEVAARGSG